MIALRHALPLIRGPEGTAVAFESRWLRVAVQDAACRAGYTSWWLVDDLVAGISLYLRDCYVKNVIDLLELEHLVCAALNNIGYEEVAACFRAIPPPRGISLAQCLKTLPSISSSTFFEQLAESIRRFNLGEVRHFYFYDLHACVDQLQNEAGAGRLPAQECLRAKIVSFVRESVRSQSWNHQVWCSIS